jgi:5-methylcytosine-specific restriction endonuclease McrA
MGSIMADEAYPETKACSKCGDVRPLAEYYRNQHGRYGRHAACRACMMAKDRAYKEANRNLLRMKDRERIAKDREKHNAKGRKWRAENPGRQVAATLRWMAANPEKVRANQRRQRATPRGRLLAAIRSGVHRGLVKGAKRRARTFDLLGYLISDLADHLEKGFLPGMTWANYGSEWHIDHIVPLAAFNFDKPTDHDFGRAWALKNLQPLWSADNRKKHAKTMKPFQPGLAI